MGGNASLFNPFSSSGHEERLRGLGKGDPEPNKYADELAKISSELFSSTDPLRKGLIGRSQSFLDGNMDVTASPMYAALKTSTDTQFNRARDNTIAHTAAGGGLTDALANLESNRANTMVRGTGSMAADELNRATGLATGLLPVGSGGLGQAAGIQGQQQAMMMAQQQQASQNAGNALGAYMAMK